MLDHSEYYRQWQTDHPGKVFSDIHGKWWIGTETPPLFHDMSQWEQEEVVIAALIQEGIPAWHGDATSIIAQMIAAQSKARIST